MLPLDIFAAAVNRFLKAEKIALQEWRKACDCSEPGLSSQCQSCPYYKKLGLLIQAQIASSDKDFGAIMPSSNEDPYSEDTKKQALRMFDLGYSIQEIQYLLDIPSRRTIRKWFREFGKLPGLSEQYPDSLKEQCLLSYANGLPPKEIEDAVNVPADTITLWAAQAGISRERKYTLEEKQACLKLYERGNSSNAIFERTGIPAVTIRSWIAEAGIGRGQKRYSEEEKEHCIQLYLAGKSSTEVAKLTGVKGETIRSWLRKANLSRGSQGASGRPSV